MKKYLYIALFFFISTSALASTGGGGLPWETPLERIMNSISGPVAYSISVMMVIGASLGLYFSGEFGAIVKTMCIIVLVAAITFSATRLFSTLFSTSSLTVKDVVRLQKQKLLRGVNG